MISVQKRLGVFDDYNRELPSSIQMASTDLLGAVSKWARTGQQLISLGQETEDEIWTGLMTEPDHTNSYTLKLLGNDLNFNELHHLPVDRIDLVEFLSVTSAVIKAE